MSLLENSDMLGWASMRREAVNTERRGAVEDGSMCKPESAYAFCG